VVDAPSSGNLVNPHARFVLPFPLAPSVFDGFDKPGVFLPAVFGEGGKVVGTDMNFGLELFGQGLGGFGIGLEIPFQFEHQRLKVVDGALKTGDPFG